jgi:hypothetical protein
MQNRRSGYVRGPKLNVFLHSYIYAERSFDPYLLLQPLHRASPAHRKHAQRCKFHRYDTPGGPKRETEFFGSKDITMYETLIRPHEVTQAPALPRIDDAAEKLKRQERIREDKRLRQIAAARAHHAEKRKREDSLARGDDLAEPVASELEPKRPKTAATAGDDGGDVDMMDMNVVENDEDAPDEEVEEAESVVASTSAPAPAPALAPATQVFSRHSKEARGHSSFLTFACLLPAQTPAH